MQAYKHIFTSPSSVEKEVKATRSGNARIHGMTRVTTASLAYVATQVRLALELYHLNAERPASFASPCHRHRCSVGLTPRRTRNDSTRVSWTSWMTPKRRMTLPIYWTGGIGRCSTCAPPLAKADTLIIDSQVFPSHMTSERAITKQSALAKLKEKRALKQIQNGGPS
jgi:hypothetical protein